MDITIGVTVDDDTHATLSSMAGSTDEVEKVLEELLVHKLVADNDFVMSAVILRPDQIATPYLNPDEDTRQSR